MKISTINSIELSSICDNKCQYCASPLQHKYRKTGFMGLETFKWAIGWVKHFANKGTQREVNLFGVGESTLHPDLLQFIEYARKNIPLRIPLHMNTNGNTMTETLARNIKEAGCEEIDITGHKPYETAKTIRIFDKVGIKFKVSFDPILAPNNWAGQVDWFEPNYPKPYPCPWIGRGQVMVMSNGDVTTCCLDAFGKGIVGRVLDQLNDIDLKPFELCKDCHHTL